MHRYAHTRAASSANTSIRCGETLAMAGLLLVALCACGQEPVENSNRLSPAALAPTLLMDQAEIESYVEAFPSDRYEVVDVPQLGKFYLDDNPALVKKALRAGRRWEADAQEVMAQYSMPGTTVLDVGAHIGSHTLALARFVGSEGIVYAFEPQKKIYRELVKNIELNDLENVVPLRFAVGSQRDIIEMAPTLGRDGTTRVGKGGDQVELRRIDSFGFTNVSMIKVDVEGYEVPVLLGAEKTIQKWHPAIIVEILAGEDYENAAPEQKAAIDSIRYVFRRLEYELTLISCGGGCDYLGQYVGDSSTP